jgi:hypothetical protein
MKVYGFDKCKSIHDDSDIIFYISIMMHIFDHFAWFSPKRVTSLFVQLLSSRLQLLLTCRLSNIL